MKKITNQAVALLTIVAIIFGMMGCSKEKSNDSDYMASENSDELTTTQGGRLIEEEIELPFGKEEFYLSMAVDSLKTIYLYSRNEDGAITQYCKEGSNDWVSCKPEWINKISSSSTVGDINVVYGEDNNFYALYRSDNTYGVARKLNEQDNECISISGGAPGGLAVSENGSIIIPRSETVDVYDSTGNQKVSLESGSNPSQVKTTYGVYKNQLVTQTLNGDGVIIYDLETQKILGEYLYNFKEEDEPVICFDEEGKIYIGDSTGISQLDISIEEWKPRYFCAGWTTS